MTSYRGWDLELEHDADLVVGHATVEGWRMTTRGATAEEVEERLREEADDEAPLATLGTTPTSRQTGGPPK